LIYHKIQITIKQDSYTKANESGEEAQKETMRLIDKQAEQRQLACEAASLVPREVLQQAEKFLIVL